MILGQQQLLKREEEVKRIRIIMRGNEMKTFEFKNAGKIRHVDLKKVVIGKS